jgi:hypothetical protein
MNIKISRLTIGVCLLFALLLPSSSLAAVSDWQRGVTMLPKYNTDFGSDSFKRSVDKAKTMGVNYITLLIPLAQDNQYSSNVYRPGHSSTDDSLQQAVAYVHSLGLKVQFFFHVDVGDGSLWRAEFQPSDKNAWFASYQSLMVHFATLAQSLGVEQIALSSELVRLTSPKFDTGNTSRWRNVIAAVRKVYTGKLTYSGNRKNWDGNPYNEASDIEFWDQLDYVGISAYYPVNGDRVNPTVAQVSSRWQEYDSSEISVLAQKFNKPVIFTEVGYRSMDGALEEPWNWARSDPYNGTVQAVGYEGLAAYWKDKPYFGGIQIWNWNTDPNAGGVGNTDFTPQNKPAQATLTTLFGGSSSTPAPNPSPPPVQNNTSNTSYSVNLSGTPQAGVPVTVNVSVNNTSLNDGVIDFEIYTTQGQQTFQKFFQSERLTGQSKTYSFTWTPSQNNRYILKAGIFSTNWSSLLRWDNELTAIQVGSMSLPSSAIDIWWPTNGAVVSGTQPLKAMVSGLDVSQYSMYWQLGSGALNVMLNNPTDYPHKEASVNVNDFGSNGQYTITFIAKDLSGNTIASRSATITLQK